MLSDPTNIVLMIAAIMVFWKLKSVLGQRTGFEQPPTPPVANSEPSSNVIELKPNLQKTGPIWKDHAPEGSALAKGLEAIVQIQKDFSVVEFITGAKSAYEMILSDFAKGDKAGLKPLLSPQVYGSFAAAIDELAAKNQSKLFQFVGITSTKLISANVTQNRATIELQFDSELISATLDQSGNPIAGDSTAIQQNAEAWTFERDISSRDPNWKLVATSDAVA